MKKINQNKKPKSKSLTKYKLPVPNYIDVPNTDNNKINNIKKFDINKLTSLLDDLIKKDLEYDLIIQGYKEKINAKKRENNFLQKEVEQMKLENNNMNKKNNKIKNENDFKTKEKKIEINYKNNINNINMMNIKEKYNQEIKTNKEIKEKIIKIKNEIRK